MARGEEDRWVAAEPPTGSLSLAAGAHTSLCCSYPALPAPRNNLYTVATLGREFEAFCGAGHATCVISDLLWVNL